MPFPNLALARGRTNHSEGTGVPDNGINEFAHNWALELDQVTEDLIDLEFVIPAGSSVSDPRYVGLTLDRLSLRISFTQSGSDSITVIAKHIHSASA